MAKFLKVFIILFGLAFLSYLLTAYNQPESKPDQFFFGAKNLVEDDSKIKQERASKINSVIDSRLPAEGKYAVYIKDLKSGETFERNAQELFGSASIYKLGVMYKTYDALKKGNLQQNTVLSGSQQGLDSTLNPNNKNAFDNTISESVDEALRLMITISDNYSALLLAEKFGWANIEDYLKNQGIENFLLATEPKATAASTAQILEKIYKGQAVSREASNEMRKLLLSQTVNDRIPKYLPQNTKVAHKTGELDGIRNDAGIVYGKRGDYIFVFFSDTENPQVSSEKIATLARDIYNELEQ